MTALPPNLLLTGAAGTLGRAVAPALAAGCERLVISDLAAPLAQVTPPPGAHAVPCDLADKAAVRSLLQGIDAVVHFGGISYEKPFETVLEANIRGVFHLYEAARLAGTKRIVFASSNHVTGCYDQSDRIGPTDPPRPDGYYGLSKLYGEGMASMYWDRFGIETVCISIGSALPEPPDRRGLSTWLSLRDLDRLLAAGLTAPGVGFLVAYGMSGNPRAWWDTADAWAKLGFTPLDSSEPWAERLQHAGPPPDRSGRHRQGGIFLDIGPFED